MINKITCFTIFIPTGLFLVWGVSFMLITVFIAIFKKEKDNRLEDNHIKLNIFENYSLLLDILKLPSMLMLSIALLTSRVNNYCIFIHCYVY